MLWNKAPVYFLEWGNDTVALQLINISHVILMRYSYVTSSFAQTPFILFPNGPIPQTPTEMFDGQMAWIQKLSERLWDSHLWNAEEWPEMEIALDLLLPLAWHFWPAHCCTGWQCQDAVEGKAHIQNQTEIPTWDLPVHWADQQRLHPETTQIHIFKFTHFDENPRKVTP